MSEMKHEKNSSKRRDLLKILGVTGAAVAVSGALSPLEAVAASGSNSVLSVPNVAALNNLSGLADGDTVMVGGYFRNGDGGAKVVRWMAGSAKAPNGGTVHAHASNGNGRFEVVHSGTADYRWFGIFGMDTPADDAFDAMAADTSITTIMAYTNLHFVKRHKITRSKLTLDFNNFTVITDGIEASGTSVEQSALFRFTGETVGGAASTKLDNDLKEYNDVYEMPKGYDVAIGQWFVVKSDTRPGFSGGSAQEINKMIRVTEKCPPSASNDRYRFDYEPAYTIAKGRTISYQKVNPIADITVKNMKFVGNGAGANGSHPVTFNYGVRCNVDNLHAAGTFAAVVMRNFCTHYTTENSSLCNPPDIITGGRGYFTQQLQCLYGNVKNCKASMSRHLNDFTQCAYMLVENCYSNGDVIGAFVTHGQFEHDLTYISNSGLMSFANSGETWGSSAKNILVKKHTGPNLNGGNAITNLTLEDCHIVYEEIPHAKEPLAPRMNGTIHVNCDGIIMRNCTADKMLYLWAKSNLTTRPNIIENCTFALVYDEANSLQQPNMTPVTPRITQPVTFINTKFTNCRSNHFLNSAPLTFVGCTFEGAGAEHDGLDVRSYQLTFDRCKFVNFGLSLRCGETDKAAAEKAGMTLGANVINRVIIRDTRFEGKFNKGAVTVEAGSLVPYVIDMNGVDFAMTGDSALITATEKTLVAGFKLVNSNICGGKSNLGSSTGFAVINGNYLEKHTFTGLPTAKQSAGNVNSGSSGM